MITNWLNKLFEEKLEYKVNVITSNRPDLCDFQIDEAFKLAKELHKSPFEIANDIVSKINEIDGINDILSKVEVVNGFINMTVTDSFINKIITMMNKENKYCIDSDNKKVVIDYGGPNVAKPLHVGHLRSAIIGESIKRILKYKGNDVTSDVHLGDYGLQIGEVIYAIQHDGVKDEDITLEYLNEAYPRMSGICKENEDIKKECEEITKKMQDGNPEYNRLCDIICEISINDIKGIYDDLSVSFDLWESEKSAYKYINELEELLKNKGLLYTSQGAEVIDVAEETDSKEIPPMIFKKSNGAYLYGTTDMATIYDRESKFHPDNILYITDDRQSMHFTQVFRASLRSGITDATLEHKGYGTVNGPDGKPFKTRAGNAPSLRDMLNETRDIFISKKEENKDMSEEDLNKIVNAIIKFADLQNNLQNDYIFDINKFSNTAGKTGPYMQYTVLRLKKIIDSESIKDKLSSNIYNEVDRNLRLKISNLPEAFNNAYENRTPSYIVDYIYDLANEANNFYQLNHIAGLDDEQKKNDWLYILNLTVNILTDMLYLIGIEIPSYM
ncbi:MAG: arginine--tRNA ligase [Bacilli bacterium]|nr:arginine--tRNA ligase [Bacilli bacterium]